MSPGLIHRSIKIIVDLALGLPSYMKIAAWFDRGNHQGHLPAAIGEAAAREKGGGFSRHVVLSLARASWISILSPGCPRRRPSGGCLRAFGALAAG